MVLRNADGPLEVQIPHEGADRPAWAKVGIITALGFVLGVAWPRVVGVRVGPSLPEATSSAIGSAPSADPLESVAPPSSVAAAQAPPVAAALATAPVATSADKLPPARGPLTSTRTMSSSRTQPAGAANRSGDDSADGSAQVVWEVAIVRDAPKTGKIIARLQRGTMIRAGQVKDGWYPVKFGDGLSSDGWVYRGAIGR